MQPSWKHISHFINVLKIQLKVPLELSWQWRETSERLWEMKQGFCDELWYKQDQNLNVCLCVQVILMGLDSAGKSTLLARLLTGQVSLIWTGRLFMLKSPYHSLGLSVNFKVMETSPTIGFNVGTLDLDKKTSLTVWDVGGQKSMRTNWR